MLAHFSESYGPDFFVAQPYACIKGSGMDIQANTIEHFWIAAGDFDDIAKVRRIFLKGISYLPGESLPFLIQKIPLG
jgi:hypothetical protein